MAVAVQVQYYGKYAEKVGSREEAVFLDEDISKAYVDLRIYLKQQYGIEKKSMIIFNQVHIQRALKEDCKVTSDCVFKVIPFLSGG